MKIVRYRDRDDLVNYAQLRDDGSYTAIEADREGRFVATDKLVEIGWLLAPVEPTAILGIGMNYQAHADETGRPAPERPLVFMKMPSALQNPGEPIYLPRELRSDEVDFEAELAVIIGRECYNVEPANALDYVLGYTCANDVSARDWQFKYGQGQFCRGKTFRSFCPLGPCFVTTDEIEDPATLTLRGYLNGEKLQESAVADLIFDVPALIAFLSASTILAPGTVILTGTPSGVGYARTPPRFLQPGDDVTVEIDGIGKLTNPVREEGQGAAR